MVFCSNASQSHRRREVIFPKGNYPKRGAARAHHGCEIRRFTIEGESVDMGEIRRRIGAEHVPHAMLTHRIRDLRRNGMLTWAKLRAYKPRSMK